MKINFLPFAILLFFASCTEEAEKKSSDEKEKEDVPVETPDNDFKSSPLKDGISFQITGSENALLPDAELRIGYATDELIHINVVHPDGGSDNLKFSPENLVATVPVIAKSNEFHQKLAVYTSEKKWLIEKAAGKINHPSVGKYEIWNPPYGQNWILVAYGKEQDSSKVIAAHTISVPDTYYGIAFRKKNGLSNENLLAFRYSAPEIEKIDYNKLRKMGKFYEGFAVSTGNLPVMMNGYFSEYVTQKLNTIKQQQFFLDNEFKCPAENNDSSSVHSLKELNNIKTFTYKTSYSLFSGSKDSLLEIQFDFRTKEGNPTQRLVTGGIPIILIPFLSYDDGTEGLYIPIGFSNDKKMPDAFCLMSNMSGYWSDNIWGRNIDGVIIHFDKFSKSKIHIWLVGGYGMVPMVHYISNLDQLQKK